MLHNQVTIIGPKQRYIWSEDKVDVRRFSRLSLYGLCLAFTSSFYVTQVGRTILRNRFGISCYIFVKPFATSHSTRKVYTIQVRGNIANGFWWMLKILLRHNPINSCSLWTLDQEKWIDSFKFQASPANDVSVILLPWNLENKHYVLLNIQD